MKKVKFKGGSLSETFLVIEDSGDAYVRKTVSLTTNREYGFQRWYSQLKRIQRYNNLFPGVFPALLRFGKTDDMAYFDMEYFAEAVTAQEYLEKSVDEQAVDAFFSLLLNTMGVLHDTRIPSCADSIDLYIYEEIEQKIKDCLGNSTFIAFLKFDTIVFNGVEVRPLLGELEAYKQLFKAHYLDPTETFTHGNITLENLLYIPAQHKIVFIDPYEENVIDSVLAEYSQLYQSCNAKYEMYNARNATVAGNTIALALPASFGLDCFNTKLTQHIRNHFSHHQYIVIKLLEISQFIRMLPFKMAVDESKMIFFYGLASYLLHQLMQEIHSPGGDV